MWPGYIHKFFDIYTHFWTICEQPDLLKYFLAFFLVVFICTVLQIVPSEIIFDWGMVQEYIFVKKRTLCQ